MRSLLAIFLGFQIGTAPVELAQLRSPAPRFAASVSSPQELAAQQAELNGLQQRVGQIEKVLETELRPTCTSETRVQAGTLKITDTLQPVKLNLFTMISNPTDGCLPGQLRITATYFDAGDAFLCSGTLTIPQPGNIQNTWFEFRPYEIEMFARWWDGSPAWKQQTLVCRDYQGNDLRSPADQSAYLRVYATAFPKRGGLSTAEIRLDLPRFQRQ